MRHNKNNRGTVQGKRGVVDSRLVRELNSRFYTLPRKESSEFESLLTELSVTADMTDNANLNYLFSRCNDVVLHYVFVLKSKGIKAHLVGSTEYTKTLDKLAIVGLQCVQKGLLTKKDLKHIKKAYDRIACSKQARQAKTKNMEDVINNGCKGKSKVRSEWDHIRSDIKSNKVYYEYTKNGKTSSYVMPTN